MIGAIIAFACMAVAGRTVSVALDTFEIMLYRSLFGIMIVLSFARMFGTLGQVTLTRWRGHMVRNIAHFTGQNLWFYAIFVLPLAQVFALEFTTPIWVLLLSPLFLNDRISGMGVLSAFIGFCGVLLVTRPDLTGPLNPGLFAGAGAAVAFAITAIITRDLTKTESITTILVYLTCFQAVFGLICAGYDGDIAIPSRELLPFVIAIGIAGLTAHFCMTKALALAPAHIVMPIDFVRLPVIAIVGMVLYNEPIDIFVFIGATVIFLANYLNLWSVTRGVKP